MAAGGGIRRVERNRSRIAQSGFIVRGSQYWNALPLQVRQSESKSTFKVKINEWIRSNVPIHS